MFDGEHYSSCLIDMLNWEPCKCDLIEALLSGQSTKEYYVDDFGGGTQDD